MSENNGMIEKMLNEKQAEIRSLLERVSIVSTKNVADFNILLNEQIAKLDAEISNAKHILGMP